MTDLVADSHMSRLQWLRKTYLNYMRIGDDRSANYYRRLADEEWAAINPIGVLYD